MMKNNIASSSSFSSSCSSTSSCSSSSTSSNGGSSSPSSPLPISVGPGNEKYLFSPSTTRTMSMVSSSASLPQSPPQFSPFSLTIFSQVNRSRSSPDLLRLNGIRKPSTSFSIDRLLIPASQDQAQDLSSSSSSSSSCLRNLLEWILLRCCRSSSWSPSNLPSIQKKKHQQQQLLLANNNYYFPCN